jgi:hypothetical protein
MNMYSKTKIKYTWKAKANFRKRDSIETVYFRLVYTNNSEV